MGKVNIEYSLVELGNGVYDFSMKPTTIKFRSKKQADRFFENLKHGLASPQIDKKATNG